MAVRRRVHVQTEAGQPSLKLERLVLLPLGSTKECCNLTRPCLLLFSKAFRPHLQTVLEVVAYERVGQRCD